MKIEIKKLSLSNFKGIRSFTILFTHITNIFGENATGKTTLMDAFLWLLFGKDSTDRKDFEIKTLDANNQPFHKLDHEVEAVLLVNGNEIQLRRSFREKWTKKRGSTESEFSGHETAYFWNDVPMKQEEYQAKIATLLDEKLFKLITNTMYFNSLKWQDRRAVLMQMAGNISDDAVLDEILNNGTSYDFTQLINALKADKTIDEFKKEISAKKKKLKDELILLPSRIEEANRALPEEKDYSQAEAEITALNADIENVDSLLMNKSQAAKAHQQSITEKIKEAGDLRARNQQIEFEVKNNVQQISRDRQQFIINKKSALRSKQDAKNDLLVNYNKDAEKLSKIEKEKEELVNRWETVAKEELIFNDKEFHCPACKRAYETNDVEAKKAELTANFNSNKSKRLDEIVDAGKLLADEITVLQAKLANTKEAGSLLKAEIETLQNDIATLEAEHARLSNAEDQQVKDAIAANIEYSTHLEQIETLNVQINTPYKADDNSALLQRKKELQAQVDDLKQILSARGQREKQLARIDELQTQEATMAQELAGLEGVEFSIEQFTKAKMDTLENRINGRFKIVRFKMFEEQINGGQTEACTTLINGVPYADANTAAKIQAGLDIINTLSEYYDVQAPVWVDNRESVINLPETDCQLINLIVSASDKKLRVTASEAEMAEV